MPLATNGSGMGFSWARLDCFRPVLHPRSFPSLSTEFTILSLAASGSKADRDSDRGLRMPPWR